MIAKTGKENSLFPFIPSLKYFRRQNSKFNSVFEFKSPFPNLRIFWFIEYRLHFNVMRQWKDRLYKDTIGYKKMMIEYVKLVLAIAGRIKRLKKKKPCLVQ